MNNGTNWVAVIGAIAAAILAVVQGFHGSAIGDLESETMPKSTIEAHVDNLEKWQTAQDERINALEQQHETHEHVE